MPLSAIYQTRASFFWSTRHTQRLPRHTQRWTRLPYTQTRLLICSILKVNWLVSSNKSEWIKPCKFAVEVSIDQKKKTKKQKKDRKQREKNIFLALSDLVRSSNKVFMEEHSLFIRQQQTHWWIASEIFIMIKIQNNEMLQSNFIDLLKLCIFRSSKAAVSLFNLTFLLTFFKFWQILVVCV